MLHRPALPVLVVRVLAAVVLVAGCGSTVASSGVSTTGASNPGGGAADSGLGGPAASPGASAGMSAARPGAVPAGGVATGPGTSVGAGASPAGTSASGPVMGPGITATKIYVGMVYDPNQDTLNQAAGAKGISVGDTKADGQAIADDINHHGGIAGRQVVPVFQQVNSTSSEPVDQQLSAVCQYFTHDQRVFAVVGVGGSENYRACLAKAGIVMLDEDLPGIGDDEFGKYPALVELAYPRLSRIATATVNALAAQHYFSPWNATLGGPATSGKAKVGVLTIDSPGYAAAVDHVLIPGLRRLGYDPGPDVERIAPADNEAQVTDQAAATKSAELKFSNDNVTHVVVFEANGGMSLLFMNEAESQHYRPRYGVNSGSGLETLLAAGDIQQPQAVGAVGFGWIPAYDEPANLDPDNGPYSNAERQHCVAVFKAHGITFDNPNAEFAALEFCSTLDLLKLTLNRTPNALTAAAFVQVVGGLGGAYTAPTALGTQLDASHHDGVNKGYYWRYFDDCQCLHYTGSLQTIPG